RCGFRKPASRRPPRTQNARAPALEQLLTMKTFSRAPVTIRYDKFVRTVFGPFTVISPFLPVFRHTQAPRTAPESFFCLSGYLDTPVFWKRPPQTSYGEITGT